MALNFSVMSRSIGSVVLGLILLAGCQATPRVPAPAAQAPGRPAAGQAVFASDDAAAKDLIDAAKARDKAGVDRILGPVAKELGSGDAVADANGFESFATHAAEGMRVEKRGAALSVLHIGAADWPFPIPLVKSAEGTWFFDTAAGKQEILARRVGRNELEAINVCRAYVVAQREYASVPRDGTDVLKYAQHVLSHPGTKDGLYWEATAGEEQSPFGPLMAQAEAEGYMPKKGSGRQPYHGYYYRILTKQGPDAPNGRYDYVINGSMIGGFAMIAWPAEYGNSGVMTFIVSHQGKVYEKDLGEGTDGAAPAIREYNPDVTWKLVKE